MIEQDQPRTITELKRRIEAKTLTINDVRQVVAALLDANKDLNAFISIMLEVTSQGKMSLPLAGVPIGIKDFFDTAGLVIEAQDDFVDLGNLLEQVDLVVEKRPIQDRHDGFRRVQRQRTQPRALASGEQNGLHLSQPL